MPESLETQVATHNPDADAMLVRYLALEPLMAFIASELDEIVACNDRARELRRLHLEAGADPSVIHLPLPQHFQVPAQQAESIYRDITGHLVMPTIERGQVSDHWPRSMKFYQQQGS